MLSHLFLKFRKVSVLWLQTFLCILKTMFRSWKSFGSLIVITPSVFPSEFALIEVVFYSSVFNWFESKNQESAGLLRFAEHDFPVYGCWYNYSNTWPSCTCDCGNEILISLHVKTVTKIDMLLISYKLMSNYWIELKKILLLFNIIQHLNYDWIHSPPTYFEEYCASPVASRCVFGNECHQLFWWRSGW